MHEISRFSTTMIVAIYIYNKFIYFISILLARIIVVLNLPISCTEIEFVVFSIFSLANEKQSLLQLFSIPCV